MFTPSLRGMIAVVTGSSGFVGSSLVRALRKRGAIVRLLHRPSSIPDTEDAESARFVVDLLDPRSVRTSDIWDGATHVFHVGGVTRGRTLEQFRRGNVAPTVNIAAALVQRGAALERFVHVSSQAASGPSSSSRPTTERDEPAPVESYGRSKLDAEVALRRLEGRLPITVIRPSAVYGPRDGDFLKAFRQATSRVGFHAARRTQAISIVHVEDLVRALMMAAEQPKAVGETFFVANEEPVTWEALYGLVAEAASTPGLALQLPRWAVTAAGRAADAVAALTGKTYFLGANRVALGAASHWTCNTGHIRTVLGWQENYSLQQGICETYLAYVAAGLLRGRS